MDKQNWKKKIKKACVDAGTYQKFFEGHIDMQADIMVQLEKATETIEDAPPVIEQTNKGGFTNTVRNPAFTVWADINRLAMAGWKELGLTPAGLKKINEETFEKTKETKKGNSLIELLRMKQAAEKEASNGG